MDIVIRAIVLTKGMGLLRCLEKVLILRRNNEDIERALRSVTPSNEIWKISITYRGNRTMKLAPIGVSFSYPFCKRFSRACLKMVRNVLRLFFLRKMISG